VAHLQSIPATQEAEIVESLELRSSEPSRGKYRDFVRCQWLLVILVTQEAEIKKIVI
jgi:hypothetical protein